MEAVIRHARESDIPQLLPLMKKLAKFEGYIEQFSVTEEGLLAHGFTDKPNYTALVAEGPDGLLGYLVYYLIPFTFDLNPNLFIKELYVQAEARGLNLGQGLMKLAIEDANKLGCARIKWDVLADNHPAQTFYQKLGGRHDTNWQGFVLEVC